VSVRCFCGSRTGALPPSPAAGRGDRATWRICHPLAAAAAPRRRSKHRLPSSGRSRGLVCGDMQFSAICCLVVVVIAADLVVSSSSAASSLLSATVSDNDVDNAASSNKGKRTCTYFMRPAHSQMHLFKNLCALSVVVVTRYCPWTDSPYINPPPEKMPRRNLPVGRLGSGPRLMGRVGLGIRVSASF